jgi:hypothetical protein
VPKLSSLPNRNLLGIPPGVPAKGIHRQATTSTPEYASRLFRTDEIEAGAPGLDSAIHESTEGGIYVLCRDKRLTAKSGKKRSSQVTREACSLGTPIPQICVVSINEYVENFLRCMVNNARK